MSATLAGGHRPQLTDPYFVSSSRPLTVGLANWLHGKQRHWIEESGVIQIPEKVKVKVHVHVFMVSKAAR